MNLSDLVGFGKYKRDTYGAVYIKDPEYLVWMYVTIPGKLEGEVLNATVKWMESHPEETGRKINSISKAKASAKTAAEKAEKEKKFREASPSKADEEVDPEIDPVDGSFIPSIDLNPAPWATVIDEGPKPEAWGSW